MWRIISIIDDILRYHESHFSQWLSTALRWEPLTWWRQMAWFTSLIQWWSLLPAILLRSWTITLILPRWYPRSHRRGLLLHYRVGIVVLHIITCTHYERYLLVKGHAFRGCGIMGVFFVIVCLLTVWLVWYIVFCQNM